LGVLAATDFFTVEVLTWVGLVRYYVLFFMDIKTRRVHVAWIAQQPHGASFPIDVPRRQQTRADEILTRHTREFIVF
jgi:hypothetical protein